MKRKIALLLALAMVLSILPMNVFAAMPAVTGGGTRMGMIAEPAGPARNVRDWGDGVAVGRQWIVDIMYPPGPSGVSPAPQGNLRHILADAAYFAGRNDGATRVWMTMNIHNVRRWLGRLQPTGFSPAISVWATLDNNLTGGVTQFTTTVAMLPTGWHTNPSQVLVPALRTGTAATNFNTFVTRSLAASNNVPNQALTELIQAVNMLGILSPLQQESFLNAFFTNWTNGLIAISMRGAPPTSLGLPQGFPVFAAAIIATGDTTSRVELWRPFSSGSNQVPIPAGLINWRPNNNLPGGPMTAAEQAATMAFMTSTDNWVQLPIEYITSAASNSNPVFLQFFENSGWPQAGQIRPGGGVPGRTEITATTEARFSFGTDGDTRTFHRYQRGILPAIRIAEGAQGAFDDQFWWIELTIQNTGFYFTEDSMEDIRFTTRWGSVPATSVQMGGNNIATGTPPNLTGSPWNRLGWWDGWRSGSAGPGATTNPDRRASHLGMLRIEDGPVRREPAEGPNRYRSLIFGVQLPGVAGLSQRTVNDWIDIHYLTIIADDRAREGEVEIKVDLYRAEPIITERDPGLSGMVILPGTGGWQWTGGWPATAPGVDPFVPNPGAPQAGGTNNPMPPVGSGASWSEIPPAWGTNATVMPPANRPAGVPLNYNPVQAPPPAATGTFQWVNPVTGAPWTDPATGVIVTSGPNPTDTTANALNTVWVWRRIPMVPAVNVYTPAQLANLSTINLPANGFWVIDEGTGGVRGTTVGTPNFNIPGRDADPASPQIPGGVPLGPPLRGYGFRPFVETDALVPGFDPLTQLWVMDEVRVDRAWTPNQGPIYRATTLPPGPNGAPPFHPHQPTFQSLIAGFAPPVGNPDGLPRVQGAPENAPLVGGTTVPALPAQWQEPLTPIGTFGPWTNTTYGNPTAGPPPPGAVAGRWTGTTASTPWGNIWNSPLVGPPQTGWGVNTRRIANEALPGHAGPAGSNTNALTNWHLYGTYTWGAPNVAGQINLTANQGRPYYQRGVHVDDGVITVGRFGTLGLEFEVHPEDSADDHWLLTGVRDWQFSREVTNDGRRPIGAVTEILDDYNHLTARVRLRELSAGALAATGANPVTFSFDEGIQILGARIWTNDANFSRFNNTDDRVFFGDRFDVADSFLGASIERNTLTVRPEIGNSVTQRWRLAAITVEFYISVMPGFEREFDDAIWVHVVTSDASTAGGEFTGSVIAAHAEDPIEVDTTVATVGAINPAEFGSLHTIAVNDITITEVLARNLEVGSRLWIGVEGGLSRGFGAADHISLTAGDVEVVGGGTLEVGPLRSDTHGAYVEIVRASNVDGAQIIFRDVLVSGRVFADTEYNIIVAGNAVAANWEEFLWLDGDLPSGIARGGIHGFFHEEPYPTPAFVFAGEDVGITELPAPAPPPPAPETPSTAVGMGPTVLHQNVAFLRPTGEPISPSFEMVPTASDPLNTSTAFISVRAIGDILGWELNWSSPTATFTKPNGDVLVFTLNEPTATLNGNPMPMMDALGSTVSARNTNDRLMVPIRFFRDLGINVQWLGGQPGSFSIAVTP